MMTFGRSSFSFLKKFFILSQFVKAIDFQIDSFCLSILYDPMDLFSYSPRFLEAYVFHVLEFFV